ncbi:hypothetical protein Slin15195_G069350 [Septoria linicola]|uniref:GPI anchored cell wall protein n=1 Tax=Septoria linicola TaxID=215465 RepID=A0A9Q9AXH6_9PEZI|nr:hypothetical protein Slin14017_G102090 [Septoria linicola]USW53616.1 hypothetical protein Slin15195_G069350 [Septoria linicola]
MFSNILAFAVLATTAYAQSTTEANVETTTAELLLGTLTEGFSGTVVTAAPCETIYALTCSGQEQCPDDPVTLTATQGPTAHIFNFQNSVSNSKGEGSASMSQSCSLQNVNTAVCNMYESISHNGRSSTARRQTTLSGGDLVYAQIPITGGVEILAEATGACSTATSFGRATGTSEGAARATSVSEVVKVVVPIGMAVVGALL